MVTASPAAKKHKLQGYTHFTEYWEGMTIAVASALGTAALLALGRFDAGRVVAEALRELGLRATRGQPVGPALLLERGQVRERVEARAECSVRS